MAQLRELQKVIMQRNQVIAIKDNTIAELKNEFGMRSSVAMTNTKPEEVRDVAVLALPDTKDVKCQTHGPRNQAYYRSIPAKVYTNLPNRSPSTSQERIHDCSHGSHSVCVGHREHSVNTSLRFSTKM